MSREDAFTPPIVQVALAVAAVAVIALAAFAAPFDSVTRIEADVIGEREVVRVTGPDGTTVESLAQISSGAAGSSIGRDLADELGADLTDPETVQVQTPLGVDVRPVVDVVFQIAGEAVPAQVTVADREDLGEQVLLGRSELAGWRVAIGQERLTQPETPVAPDSMELLLAARSASVQPGSLVALLPLAAVIVVVLRTVFGIATLGTFTPILLTFGFLQVGLVPSLALTAIVLAMGIAAEPLIRRAELPRVGRLAVLISAVCATLLAVEAIVGVEGAASSWGAAFPVVVAAVLVERLWEEWEIEGAATAVWAGVRTIAVALIAMPVLISPPVRFLAANVALPFVLATLVWAWLAASYRGLRVSELIRFKLAARGRTAEVPA